MLTINPLLLFSEHVHGTFWINENKIEKLIFSPNHELITGTDAELKDPEIKKPFQKIKDAFKKLRNDIPLNGEELDSVKNLIEERVAIGTGVFIII